MIVICVIVVVIGSFICALIKARIDEWREDSSMMRQWLSLKRRSNKVQGTCNDPIEISDDESFDLSSNVEKSSKESTDVMSRGAANVPNVDDASDNVFNQSQSMFKWNKPLFVPGPSSSYVFPENSGLRKVMLIKASNKRQKLMNASTSSDDSSSSDDELTNLGIFKKDDLPEVKIQHDIMIAGVKVKFPVKPYPCQIAVMNSLIQGCNKEQNCLLESPTGSGKTLALLCGALAWQEQYSEKIHREGSVLDAMDTGSSCHKDDSLHDNFFLNSSQYLEKELCDQASCTEKARKVPKIYYGTRTHKQIKQVVRELKKTVYRHKRMTILSSRQHTCIQDTNRNKNELCNELLDPLKRKSCRYYNDHSKIKAILNDVKKPWDIEDLVSLGRNIRACPYFGARSLMENAEIIFCPYNYILDPDIRGSMQINLKDDIVILDEAHNVEDLCREAASVKLRDDEFTIAIKECEHLLNKGRNHATYSTIREYLTDIVKFLKNVEVKESRPSGFDDKKISKNWFGIEFRVLLDVHNVGCSRFPIFLAASKSAIEDFAENMREENREKMIPTISRDTKRILEHLCFAMQMITSDIFVNDYRMYVTETFEPIKKFATENVWLSAKTDVSSEIRTMKMICMNPSIIFAPLARTVRSVIVASGTLTPTASFQSELGTQFPHIVNPNHIIPKDQVYVRCIPRGPSGISLKATYDAVNSWKFQDELGKLILQVCDSVPYGVLCFFSSYKTMRTIHDRWKSNGMWKKLSDLKEIFVEPEDNRELDEVMMEYRRVIEESSSKSFRIACGAIFFAIYRGKVAEGIDFSDNEARCVLAVGIPYLFKNNDVDMKMMYNDSNKSKGLLSGSEWYTINAFRALNQAIGRCVRHKGDWGAVLLIDERHQQSSNLFARVYTNYLSKWIKTNMKPEDKNDDLETALQDFVALQVAREKGEKYAEN